MFVDLNTIKILCPELILVIAATWMYLAGTLAQSKTWWTAFAVAAYAVAGIALVFIDQKWDQFAGAEMVFHSGPLVTDGLGHFVRLLALVIGLLFTLMVASHQSERLTTELLGTLMLIIVGVMIVARANDLVLLFLGMELISIPTYVLLFVGKRGRDSAESTAKYFFLSILASAVLLYGMSMLYGLAGTTLIAGTAEEPGIRQSVFPSDGDSPLATIALVFVLAGLGFKIAAVPFHFYAPDVYQGTTNVNAGLLAAVPKLAGIVAIIRLIVFGMPLSSQLAWQLALVLAIVTMTLGNVAALWQTNLRRMMAFSSVAHTGYLLIGVAVGLAATGSLGFGGVAATLLYIVVYVLASTGTFAALAYLGQGDREVGALDELAGLSRREPLAAAAIAIFMFSLAGIPPLAGFWGKLTLFTSAIGFAAETDHASVRTWFLALAVAGALNAAIAAAYYLRVIATMYFRAAPPQQQPVEADPRRWGPLTTACLCCLLVTIAGVAPGPLVSGAQNAENSSRRALWPAPVPSVASDVPPPPSQD